MSNIFKLLPCAGRSHMLLLMAQSLSRLLVHTVFSTKERRPFLREAGLRAEMHRYLGGILNKLGCKSVIVGGMEDHVHLLAALARTCAVAEMVKEVKRGSSLWIKERDWRMMSDTYGIETGINPFQGSCIMPGRAPKVARS